MILWRTALAALALLGALLGIAPAAAAHDGLPVALSVREVASQVYLMRVMLPPRLSGSPVPGVTLPHGCQASASPGAGAASQQALYRCDIGLAGQTVRLEYPADTPFTPTLTRVEWISGETQSVLTPPGETRIVLPAPQTVQGVLREYFVLGVRHILEGYDHLLFLACLMLLSGRRILLTVTGFTVGHAITITAASLGAISPPVRAVEAVIALSIVFIAAEVARPRRDTLTWRWPVVVSTIFGLLHGLGFASALRDMGLPQKELPAALLAFNAGIETGQLAFVLVCVALWLGGWRLLDRLVRPWLTPARLSLGLSYVVGCLAAYWLMERTLSI